MTPKDLSRESTAVVQIIPKAPSRFQRYTGLREITLKDVVTLLFTLLVPTMIGVSAVILQKNEIDLTEKNRDNDFRIGQLQRKSDTEQTEALGNETLLNNFMKNIIDMTLYYKTDATDSPQYKITRVLTITALRQINLEKKKFLIQFLYDMEYLKRGEFIFYDKDRDEDVKHLEDAILDDVDFSQMRKFIGLLLRRVSLINASFSYSNLQSADFSNSVLTGVNFSRTNLIGARFFDTQLQRTDFQEASLDNAQFIRSNLTQSNITDEQLSRALALFNTILPNGTYARNKTYMINGDAQQGLHGWNITSGEIRVVDNSFIGYNSSMMQRINTTIATDWSSAQIFQYCLSFFVHGQENLSVEITFIDDSLKFNGGEKISSIQSNSCENNFCYYSSCKYSKTRTNFMDFKFIFGILNITNDVVAIKDIQLTLIVD